MIFRKTCNIGFDKMCIEKSLGDTRQDQKRRQNKKLLHLTFEGNNPNKIQNCRPTEIEMLSNPVKIWRHPRDVCQR